MNTNKKPFIFQSHRKQEGWDGEYDRSCVNTIVASCFCCNEEWMFPSSLLKLFWAKHATLCAGTSEKKNMNHAQASKSHHGYFPFMCGQIAGDTSLIHSCHPIKAGPSFRSGQTGNGARKPHSSYRNAGSLREACVRCRGANTGWEILEGLVGHKCSR